MDDTAHRSHGLAGDQGAPDWPVLRDDEVAGVLAHYPAIEGKAAIVWRSPRPLSAAARVRIGDDAFFVKRHHVSVRSATSLAEEHAYAGWLGGQGIPLPGVLTDGEGRSALRQGDWVYEVHHLARGIDLYQDAYSWQPVGERMHAWRAGAMLGRLANASRGYAAPQRATHILVARAEILASADPCAAIDAQWRHRPALAAYLRDRDWRNDVTTMLSPLTARAAAGIARQPAAWTHGDWHVSNLAWSDTGQHAVVTDVLDLGLSAVTFALFDLATAIERNAIAWLEIDRVDIGRIDLALALIDGYRSEAPVTQADLLVLADLLPIVHIDFALSEIEYFEGVTRRRDHADVAYHAFLLGHAAWFGTPRGQAMLDAIRHAV